MRSLLAIFALVVAESVLAQVESVSTIDVDQTISQCEGKWFVAESNGGKKVLGYVYVDPTAGFTFEHFGHVDEAHGKLHAVKSELHGKARLIQRIEHDFVATCLSDAVVTALELPNQPEAMQFYKDTRPLGEHHASWANHYNHIGASEGALGHVSKARSLGYASPGLTYEHAFALNALGRFEEAIALLAPAVEQQDTPADTIAELAFAHLALENHLDAIDLYKKALASKSASQRRWEFARNIAVAYDNVGENSKRDEWLRISDEYKKGKE